MSSTVNTGDKPKTQPQRSYYMEAVSIVRSRPDNVKNRELKILFEQRLKQWEKEEQKRMKLQMEAAANASTLMLQQPQATAPVSTGSPHIQSSRGRGGRGGRGGGGARTVTTATVVVPPATPKPYYVDITQITSNAPMGGKNRTLDIKETVPTFYNALVHACEVGTIKKESFVGQSMFNMDFFTIQLNKASTTIPSSQTYEFWFELGKLSERGQKLFRKSVKETITNIFNEQEEKNSSGGGGDALVIEGGSASGGGVIAGAASGGNATSATTSNNLIDVVDDDEDDDDEEINMMDDEEDNKGNNEEMSSPITEVKDIIINKLTTMLEQEKQTSTKLRNELEILKLEKKRLLEEQQQQVASNKRRRIDGSGGNAGWCAIL